MANNYYSIYDESEKIGCKNKVLGVFKISNTTYSCEFIFLGKSE